MDLAANFQSLAGLVVLTLLAAAMAPRRQNGLRRQQGRTALAGIGLQLVIASLILKLPASQDVFLWLNGAVIALQDATTAGTSFVFGYLGGGP